MDNATARVMGGIYIALCTALSPEGVEIACDTLRGFADNPDTRPEDRIIYKIIADTATRPADEVKAENEHFEQRHRLCVIEGGGNAA
jgi:hypothetical protein